MNFFKCCFAEGRHLPQIYKSQIAQCKDLMCSENYWDIIKISTQLGSLRLS